MAIITRDTAAGTSFQGKMKTVTADRIYAFSGGFPRVKDWPKKNIHTDLEFAKSCGLSTRAASGAMFQGYLTELMIDLFGENWLSGGKMELTFIAIVDAGDKLLPMAIVQSRDIDGSRVRFVMEIWCQNQHGNKVVVGTATGFV
jgi:acyl dehydratase